MTERVYKYPLPIGDWVSITMPKGAEPLCVQLQHNEAVMWARVSIEAPLVVHHFRMAGTGHDLGGNVGRYIDTIQLLDGDLVFHIFAEDKP